MVISATRSKQYRCGVCSHSQRLQCQHVRKLAAFVDELECDDVFDGYSAASSTSATQPPPRINDTCMPRAVSRTGVELDFVNEAMKERANFEGRYGGC